MKTRNMLACFAAASTVALNVPTVADPINLDANPSFDLAPGPGDPLFAPSLLGLTSGMAGYGRAEAVASFAQAASAVFPPSAEVFTAYLGNPRFAILAGAPESAGALVAGSPFSLAGAFRGVSGPEVYPGRGTVYEAAEGPEVTLAGVQYHLTGPELWASPLVLDLNDDRVLNASRGEWQPHLSRLTGPYAAFDLDGDGYPEVMEWVGPADGLLVTSPNPRSGRDLVGTTGGWKNGFEHLAAVYDLDHNGRGEGEELKDLYVWRDLNTNAVPEVGEVDPVLGLNISWIAAVDTGNSTSSFGRPDHLPGLVWDWWPNYAPAIRRAAGPPPGGHPLLGVNAMAAIRNILFGRVVDDNSPPRTAFLPGPVHISPEQLAAAGLDMKTPYGTFRLALLADCGRTLIGYDILSSSNQPGRARLHEIKVDGDPIFSVELPFEQVYQMACDPSGRRVLVLGDYGSKLALVDFETGTVAPPEGLDLRAVGLRASGVAGDPAVRYGGGGYFYFTGWQLDEAGVVVDERVWAITPWGFWGGLSLDALRNEAGPLRQHYITGSESGFFVTPTPGNTNETLWAINGSCSDTCRVAIAQADAFGGLAAIPGQVIYTKRVGSEYITESWWDLEGQARSYATNSEPCFYPFLTEGGGTAITATLDPGTQTINLVHCRQVHALASGPPDVAPLLTTHPGQGKVARGAFAHYGTNGIDVVPVPDGPAPTAPSRIWNYTLLPGSQLVDDCPVCGRPPIVVPMQGTFQLRLIQENPLFSTYAWDAVAWTAGTAGTTTYKVVGKGTYQIGGEVGLLQDLLLEVYIDSGWTNRLCYLTITNGVHTVSRPWPLIEISVDQTNGLPQQQYHLDLLATPLREIWFSTAHDFHAGIWQSPTNYVSRGDLISSAGRIVKQNADLTRYLGIAPMVPDLGLNAVDVRPGGEIAFSIEQDVFSETLGPLYHSDVFSDRGRILTNQTALIGAFNPEPPPENEGLDALQVMENGETYFSVTNDFFSERLGRLIRRGDLLSSSGVVIRNNEDLVVRFHPADPKKDYGLDAIYVWPSGEIWFSVETGFAGEHFDTYEPGDLLSDQGYVVCRNRDLLAGFQPLEDLADFGLDALFVVTDALPAAPPPSLSPLNPQPEEGTVTLTWDGQGRVFQVEKTTDLVGPWLPVSSIMTDRQFTEVALNQGQAFYRVRQW